MRDRLPTRHSERFTPRATVIGAGKFGHAIAEIVSRQNIPTHLVTRSESRVEAIRQRLTRHSAALSVHKFGDAPLADIVFLALPSNELPEMVGRLGAYPDIADKQFALLSKGLTPPRRRNAARARIANIWHRPYTAVVSGPSLADELPHRNTHLVVASHNEDLRDYLANMLAGDSIHTHESDDPTGVEWAGIAKNVATLGFHARLAATNSRNDAGAYAAQLYSEIWEYAATLGAKPRSFIGIAGVGDLLTTSHAPTSRNVRAGQLIGKGHSTGEAEARIKQTVEAFHTVPLLAHRVQSNPHIQELVNTLFKPKK
jgi:glycerol-3-phosphate dehydrogenase (NAD(P)+)